MDEWGSRICPHHKVTDDGLACNIDLGFESSNIPFIIAEENEIKDKIFDYDIKIALNFQFIPDVSLGLLPMEYC